MPNAAIALFLLSSVFAMDVAAGADPLEIRRAVDLGLSWVHNHPCTPEDGGVTFLVLSRLAAEPEERELDLLAELIVVFRLLDLPVSVDIAGALDELVEAQQGDGSWGDSATITRGNPRRHTVMTATTAPWAYRGERIKGSDSVGPGSRQRHD